MTEMTLTAPSGINYPVSRTGAGRPVLLLHGFTGSRQTWQLLVLALAQGHAVLTVDLPGHGASTLPGDASPSFRDVVADLAWLIAAATAGRADVLGYSMGGRLALALAVEQPQTVGRLILESASPGLESEAARQARLASDEALADRILREGVPAFVAEWERLPLWESQQALDPATRSRQREIRLSHSTAGLVASLRATGTGAQPSYWEHLPRLTTPALLVAGELDAKFRHTAEEMHARLPCSTLAVVTGAGHAVHLEQPERYVKLVSQFLTQ